MSHAGLHMLELYVWEGEHRIYLGTQVTPHMARCRSKRIGVGVYELFEKGQIVASWGVVNAFELVPYYPPPKPPCPRVAALLDS